LFPYKAYKQKRCVMMLDECDKSLFHHSPLGYRSQLPKWKSKPKFRFQTITGKLCSDGASGSLHDVISPKWGSDSTNDLGGQKTNFSFANKHFHR